ncbi:hypothetical protein PFISCL1PPCAC_12577, partial [Pristionchus fissidentatus]
EYEHSKHKNNNCAMTSKTSNQLFVGRLPPDFTRQDVNDIFAAYGKIECIDIPRRECGGRRGFGFVTFQRREDAMLAYAEFKKNPSASLHVEYARIRRKDNRSETGQRRGEGGDYRQNESMRGDGGMGRGDRALSRAEEMTFTIQNDFHGKENRRVSGGVSKIDGRKGKVEFGRGQLQLHFEQGRVERHEQRGNGRTGKNGMGGGRERSKRVLLSAMLDYLQYDLGAKNVPTHRGKRGGGGRG